LIHKSQNDVKDIKKVQIGTPDKKLAARAADSEKRIVLFSSAKKSSSSRYCEVDLLVTKEEKIRIIIEI
jgi:hypothetical protein